MGYDNPAVTEDVLYVNSVQAFTYRTETIPFFIFLRLLFMSKPITMKLTIDQIASCVKNVFKKEHSEIMTECIIELLKEDDAKMEILTKCAMGIDLKPVYKVGEKHIIDTYNLSTWDWDETKMIEQGMIKDSHIVVEIISINKFLPEAYEVKYEAIFNNKGNKEKTTRISESALGQYAEQPIGD